MYSGEALALFICYYNFFMSENCCKKKRTPVSRRDRAVFFYSADGQRARSEGSRAINKKKINFLFFFVSCLRIASFAPPRILLYYYTVLRSEGAR